MMLLRIEKNCTAYNTTIRLSGRLVASNRPALSEQIESGTGKIILDLEEVTLIDLDIVQFLARCEAVGMQLLHCPPYIREWIYREQERASKV
jgi:anti-anti-sigma regulatory factor